MRHSAPVREPGPLDSHLAHLWTLLNHTSYLALRHTLSEIAHVPVEACLGARCLPSSPQETIRILLERIRSVGLDSCHKYGHLSPTLAISPFPIPIFSLFFSFHTHTMSLSFSPFSSSLSLVLSLSRSLISLFLTFSLYPYLSDHVVPSLPPLLVGQHLLSFTLLSFIFQTLWGIFVSPCNKKTPPRGLQLQFLLHAQ